MHAAKPVWLKKSQQHVHGARIITADDVSFLDFVTPGDAKHAMEVVSEGILKAEC